MDEEPRCDFVLAVLLDLENRKANSYYLFPKADFSKVQLTLTEANIFDLSQYKHSSIEAIFGSPH